MRAFALLPLLALAACATGPGIGPAEVIRYHLPQGVERGAATVEAAGGALNPAYADAVARQLAANGFPAANGGPAQFVVVVDLRQRPVAGPSRRGGFTLGIGGGSFSGGRRGGVGVGASGGIPIGGRATDWAETELGVLIKRRADQTTVWEGHARTVADLRSREAMDAGLADKLARALFTGFPGESGRTISVP